MKATFIDLLLGLEEVILPARILVINNKGREDMYAQPLLKSKEKMRKFGVKVKLNNLIDSDSIVDGDCVYVAIQKHQIPSIMLLDNYGGGSCYITSKEIDRDRYDEVIDSILYLNENIGYKSIVEKEKISIDSYNEIELQFNKIKDIIKIPENEFQEVFETRKKINDVKIIEDELEELESVKKNLKIETLDLKSKQEEKLRLQNFINNNQWVEQIKPYIVRDSVKNTSIDDGFDHNPRELFINIVDSIKARFNLSDDFIYCYLLSLFTSLIQGRFLLLTGHIGTGKSSIIKETGKLLGGQTNMVAVRPAWLDASDLLGYFDPINNRYHSTDFVRFIKQENNDHINMILLDELNIARIENYGADILACLAEIGERDQEQNKIHLFNQDLQELIHTHQLFEELTDVKKQKYQHILERIKQSSSIIIPDNVLICGTLNIDGSTENLSPKMIDRSFMLKFPDFNGLLNDATDIQDKCPLFISQIINSVKGREKIDYKSWNKFYDEYINDIKNILIPISNRVAKDYLVFCQFAEFFGIDDNNKVDALFFYARILPRLRIERLDDDNKKLLDLFKNNDLFEPFIEEIGNSKNGNFIDYQHICG